ncbi:DUF1000-domain-containing protein [Ramaria rubella]|nr:DUF1000-domain-containing protein [Ramaria rubella]
MAFLKQIGSQNELDSLLEDKKNGLVVVYFHATWCGPCHAISPIYTRLSDTYRRVTFSKVDVDDVQSVAQKYSIAAMPTFLFIKNKTVVDQNYLKLKGAEPRALEDLVKKHAPPPPAATGSGSEPTTGDISLLEFLDVSQLNCLNEATHHSVKSILASKTRNTSSSYLLSDADEQLLINISFNRAVRVRSIVLHTSVSSQGPKKIKLLINRPSLGFEDVEDQEEPAVAQVLDIPEEAIKEGRHISLRFVRFQNVNSLHIFVVSNQGEQDESRIDAIDVFGVPVETTKSLSGLKKQDD